MRQSSMTAQEAEGVLGPRGDLRVTMDNRRTVRKWLTAKGISSETAQGATYYEMACAYNDVSNEALMALEQAVAQRKAQEADGFEPPEAVAGEIARQADYDDRVNAMAAQEAVADAAQGGSLESAILNLVQGRVKAGLDESSVKVLIDERIAEIGGFAPRKIHVEIADRPRVELDGQHPIFERVLRLLIEGENVFLVGPAGCGKTRLCQSLATAMGRDFAYIAGSGGASESVLTGWLLPVDGGAFTYQPSEIVRLYERGRALILFDEFDAFDSNMIIVANAALANGHFSVPQRRDAPLVRRGPDVSFIAAANTFGFGADRVYAGRNQLDGATLDRFTVIEMDYDRGIETRIGTAGGLTASEMADLWALRDKAKEARLARIISTRAFQKAGAMKRAGDTWSATMATLVSGWTRDELAKVGLGAQS